jgi:hypothetical protein
MLNVRTHVSHVCVMLKCDVYTQCVMLKYNGDHKLVMQLVMQCGTALQPDGTGWNLPGSLGLYAVIDSPFSSEPNTMLEACGLTT